MLCVFPRVNRQINYLFCKKKLSYIQVRCLVYDKNCEIQQVFIECSIISTGICVSQLMDNDYDLRD